jgi:two-component system chemotaxis response regulator CheY
MLALVVDDSRPVRRLVSRILRDVGFEVCEASDGVEALAQLGASPDVRLALVDWNMPNMDGLTFVKSVRADSAYDDILLMMVTTENEMDQVVKALNAGANEYLMKPFTDDGLVDKLAILGLLD